MASEYGQIRSFVPCRQSHQAVNFQASGLGSELIAECVVVVVDQIGPVRNLGPKIFFNTIECTTEPSVVGGARMLWPSAKAWKPVPHFRFGGRRIQRTVEHGERTIREACAAPQSPFWPEWTIEQFIEFGALVGGSQQLPQFITALWIESKFSHELLSPRNGCQPESPSPTPSTAYLSKHNYLPATASTYSLANRRSSIDPPSSSDKGVLSSNMECGSRNQSFSTSRSRKRDHRVLRIQNKCEMRSLTSLPRNCSSPERTAATCPASARSKPSIRTASLVSSRQNSNSFRTN